MNPCPQCGATLRWIPEGNYWNCDRCGNRLAPNAAPATPQPQPQPGTYPPPMHQPGAHPHDQSGLHPPQQQGYPPQQHGYPPQGYPPQGYGHYPQPGGPKGKGKLIAIILVLAALAAGGIVVAVVLSKKGSDGGGGGGGGGFDNPEALAKATLEALAAGDADKLVSFTPSFDTMMSALDCPPEAKAENEAQAKKSLEEVKKRFADAAAKMKGSAATLKSATTDGVAKTEMKVGDAAGTCKAKVAVTMTGVSVEYDFVRPSDKSKQDHRTTYGVMIIDGKYYLLDTGHLSESIDPENGTIAEAPTPTTPDTPTPAAAGDPTALRAEMDALKTASCACADKACADAQWSKLMAFVEANKTTLEGPGAEALNAAGSESVKCLDKLRSGSATPTTPTPTTPTPTTPTEPGKGLPECEAYAKAAERFIKCSKVPKQSRDAVQTAVDQMRKNWGDPAAMSEDMRKSAAETCTTLEKSMKDAAKAIGCK